MARAARSRTAVRGAVVMRHRAFNMTIPNKILENEIRREACIFVRHRVTGKLAHVYGHSTAIARAGKPLPIREALKFAARSLVLHVADEEELQQVLEAVTRIRGDHEFTGEWTDDVSDGLGNH